MIKNIYSGLARIPKGKASDKVVPGCLVLEGGAFRGCYTSGVTDFLMLHDLNFECTIGCSAGGLNGICYVAGDIGRFARIALTYREDDRYVGKKAMQRNQGVIGFDFLFNDMKAADPLDEERLRTTKRRFVVVATDCLTGRPTYFELHKTPDIYQACRASASMPFLSKMVMINDRPYLDGGCSVKIPYQWAFNEGYKKVVVVRTRDINYHEKIDRKSYLLSRFHYRKYPEFALRLATSFQDANDLSDHLKILNQEGRTFTVYPSTPITIGRLEDDAEKMGALYWQGYHDMEKLYPSLLEYLNK